LNLLVAIVAVALSTTTSSLMAQDGNEQAGLVAVLDVAKVFKANATFESRMESIKKEADSLKAQIQQEQDAIRLRAQEVAQYEVGTSERNQLEAKIEQDQASLRTKARQAETDLLNREAKIYYDTYEQMQLTVAKLAQQYGISLVLRFDSEDIDPTNRPEVIKGVNRAVVYHHKLDLTKLVIDSLPPAAASADRESPIRK
jgi:Skp family chaperone for outer membrane proteins